MFAELYLLLGLAATCLCRNYVGLSPGYCGKGYFGLFCADICQYPTYGLQCDGKCLCSQNLCSFKDGCPDDCPAGLTGKECEISCTYPHYGYGCQKKCLCSKRLCHNATGCRNSKDHSAVKPEPKSQTNVTSTTTFTPKENIKTRKSYVRTQTAVIESERKSAGTNFVTFTTLDSSDEDIPGSEEHIKTTSSDFTFSTPVDRDEKNKSDRSGLKDEQNENSSGFWLFRFSRNRGVTVSLMVFFALLIMSLIGHLVISVVRCVIKRKKVFQSDV